MVEGSAHAPRARPRAARIGARHATTPLEPAGGRGLGGAGGVDPPVPFPNTVVKRPSADDTRRAAARDNRPVPGPSPLLNHSSYDGCALDTRVSGAVSYKAAERFGREFEVSRADGAAGSRGT